MVHIWRDHILEATLRLSKNIANCFFDRSNIKTRPEEINALSPDMTPHVIPLHVRLQASGKGNWLRMDLAQCNSKYKIPNVQYW